MEKSNMDKLIEDAYRVYFNYVQVNMLDLPKIFYEAKEGLKKGRDLNIIMKNLVLKYGKVGNK